MVPNPIHLITLTPCLALLLNTPTPSSFYNSTFTPNKSNTQDHYFLLSPSHKEDLASVLYYSFLPCLILNHIKSNHISSSPKDTHTQQQNKTKKTTKKKPQLDAAWVVLQQHQITIKFSEDVLSVPRLMSLQLGSKHFAEGPEPRAHTLRRGKAAGLSTTPFPREVFNQSNSLI